MPKLKLLVAEDSKSVQMFYRSVLSPELYETRIAPDGEQALAEYKQWHPDVILLDMNMPVLNGYQTLKTIREQLKDKSTTIIMVTSASEKEDVIACAKLGIQGYIVKPFKAEAINEAIIRNHQQKK